MNLGKDMYNYLSQASSNIPLPVLYMAVKTSSIHGVWHISRVKDVWVFAYLPLFPFLLCFSHLSILYQPSDVSQNKKDSFVFFLFFLIYCFRQEDWLCYGTSVISTARSTTPYCLQV